MEGFYKVTPDRGLSFITATFFNPITKEIRTECTRDYDYADCSHDNENLYRMPVDLEVQTLYYRYIGYITIGDQVEVYKGRKVPIGTKGTVVRRYPVQDRYNRWVADYVELDNGEKTNVLNCRYAEGD